MSNNFFIIHLITILLLPLPLPECKSKKKNWHQDKLTVCSNLSEKHKIKNPAGLQLSRTIAAQGTVHIEKVVTIIKSNRLLILILYFVP